MSTPDRSVGGSAIALWVIATVATVFFLREAAQLLIPIVIAILIGYMLEPMVAWLQRRRVPRLAGASVVLLTALAMTAGGGYALREDARQVVESMPEAARQVRAMLTAQSSNGPVASIREAADELRSGSAESAGGAPSSSGSATNSSARAPSEPEAVLGGTGSGTGDLVQRGLGSVLALAGHLTVIFFLVFFILLSGRHVRARIVEISGPDDDRRATAATIVDDINRQIQRFLVVRLATAVVVGGLTWIALAWMNVPQAAVWSILAAVFNSIPYFGPVIVSGGLLVVGLTQGGGTTQAVQMAGVALAITSLEGWLLEPPLMGKAEKMSALAVFVGLLVWTWIWGAWGTVLGVPMLVMVKSVADHIPRLKPIGRLMAP